MKVSGSGCLNNTARDIMIDAVLNNEDLNFTKFYVSEFTDTFSRLVNPAIYSDFPDAKLIDTLSGDITFSGDVTPASSTVIESGSTILPINIKLLANAIPFDIQINTVFILAEDLRGAKIELTNSTEVNTYDIGDILEQGTVTAEITWKENEYLYVKDIDDGGSDGTYASFSAGAVTEQSGAGAGTLVTSVVSEVVVYSGCVSYDESIDIDVDTPANFNIGQYVVNDAGTPARAEITGKSGSTLTLSRVNTENFSLGDNLEEVADTTTAYSLSDGVTTSAQTTNLTNSTILPFVYNADGSVNIFKINLRFSSGFPTNLNFLNTSIQEIEDHNVSQYSHDGTLLRLDGANSPSSDIDWDDNKITSVGDGSVTTDAVNYGQVKTFSSGGGAVSDVTTVNSIVQDQPISFRHNKYLVLDSNFSCFSGALGSEIIIENLHGGGIFTLDLNGFDLDIGTPTANKSNIIIRNCTSPIRIINYNATDITDITQTLPTFHNADYPIIGTAGIYIDSCTDVSIGESDGYIKFAMGSMGNGVAIYSKNSKVNIENCIFSGSHTAVYSDVNSTVNIKKCITDSGSLQTKALVCNNGGVINYRQHTKLVYTSLTGSFDLYEEVAVTPSSDTSFSGTIEGIDTVNNVLWIHFPDGTPIASESLLGADSGATADVSSYDETKIKASSGNYDIYFEGVGVVNTDAVFLYFNNEGLFRTFSQIAGDADAGYKNNGTGIVVRAGYDDALIYTFNGSWDADSGIVDPDIDDAIPYSYSIGILMDDPVAVIVPITINIQRP